MDIYSIYTLIGRRFRARRMQQFIRELCPDESRTILDVGGYPWLWIASKIRGRITLLNTQFPSGLQEQYSGKFDFVTGDGCALPYADKSFDIVFSNSVIEHVGSYERQRRFAAEVQRVGRSAWVQTPAREFFIEPHLLTPFIHWLPLTVNADCCETLRSGD